MKTRIKFCRLTVSTIALSLSIVFALALLESTPAMAQTPPCGVPGGVCCIILPVGPNISRNTCGTLEQFSSLRRGFCSKSDAIKNKNSPEYNEAFARCLAADISLHRAEEAQRASAADLQRVR